MSGERDGLAALDLTPTCLVLNGQTYTFEQIVENAAKVERLHSWAGLMELLDEHWPADIFPTLADDTDRDTGPRLVSALRWVDQLRGQVERVVALCDAAEEGKRTAIPLTWVDEAMPAVVYVSKILGALQGTQAGGRMTTEPGARAVDETDDVDGDTCLCGVDGCRWGHGA